MVRVAIAACISAVSADSFWRVSACVLERAERVWMRVRWVRWVSVRGDVLVLLDLARLRWIWVVAPHGHGHTLKLGNIHAKGIALFKHAFAAALDEVVEALGELGHALAQVVETEIHGGEVVGH